MPDFVVLFFVFAFGACVGSFLNVVVFRLPRGQSLVSPPSRCPACEHKLAWYDNLPVVGWIFLGGKCRYCRAPISSRYPIVEAITGGLFVLYYVCYFDLQVGPCPPGSPMLRPMSFARDWPVYCLHMFLIATLLAVSLIDYELFIIPPEATWLMAGVGVAVHAIIASPASPGTLQAGPIAAATAAGSLIGWLCSLALLKAGIFKISFAEGEPMMEVDPPPGAAPPPSYTKAALRKELLREIVFVTPPLVLGVGFMILAIFSPTVADFWKSVASYDWLAGALAAVLGAMVGAFLVWITRILGSLAFGRLAMGLGDVHLMFGVGAIVGAGPAAVAFFLAPFGGMALALYLIFFGKRREIPYGPYLGLGAAATLLFYCPIEAWLTPGLSGLGQALRDMTGG